MRERNLGPYDKEAMRLILAKLLASGTLDSWSLTRVLTHVGPVPRWHCEVSFIAESELAPCPPPAKPIASRDVTPRFLAPPDPGCGDGGTCGRCARCNPTGL